MRTTAYRLAVSRWRRTVRGRRPGRPGRGPGVREPRPPSEAHVALVAALKQLPEAQRQALVLHHIADLPVHDVAREVGVPEGTIKARPEPRPRGARRAARRRGRTQPCLT